MGKLCRGKAKATLSTPVVHLVLSHLQHNSLY